MNVPVASEAIVRVLQKAGQALTVDEICTRVYGRLGDRERNTVRQNLSRLFERGNIEKIPMKFVWKPSVGSA